MPPSTQRLAILAITAMLLAACAAPPPKPVPPPPPDAYTHAPLVDTHSQTLPAYPGFDVIYGIEGKAVIDVLLNDAGGIADLRVERSTGRRELDRAAIAAVRQWKFRPGIRHGRPVGGWVRVPLNFDLQALAGARNPLWPKAYAHPRYVADPTPIAYASVDAAFEQVPADAHRSLQDAHPIGQLQVHDAQGQLVQWWIFTDLDTPNAMATRLTFRGTPTDPVIAVSSLCTRPDVCAARQAITLQGPVFARSLQ